MKLKKLKNNWQLEYKYKVITNRHKKADGGVYYFYSTQLSSEIINYFGTYNYYVYKKENKLYLTTEEPKEYVYKKTTARDKYSKSNLRVISLNQKLFNLSGELKDKYLKITLNLCKKDFVTDDILVELKIV